MEKQGAVQPQVFAGTTHLVPVVPRKWWRIDFGQHVWCTAQFCDTSRIGRRQLEPLADRTVIDAKLSSDRSSRCDVLVQLMYLGNAQGATCQAPAIPLRVGIVLVGSWRRLAQTTKQRRLTDRWRRREGATYLLNNITDSADHPSCGVEQAQLVPGCGPDLLQHRRVQARIVGDDFVEGGNIRKINVVMKEHVDAGRLAGASGLIARNGKVVFHENWGDMKADTIVRMYSMTKGVTGVAAMILYEEGKFAMMDPV